MEYTYLFLDTSNSFFISALIKNKKIIDFIKIKSNKNMVEMSNEWLNNFLEKNNTSLKEISGFYLTIGPGSFTGQKVSLEISKTLDLYKKLNLVATIDSFDFQRIKEKYSIFTIGKNKWIYKKYSFFKKNKQFKFTTNFNFKKNKSFSIDNEKVNIENLELKLKDGSFKMLDNIEEIKLIYFGDVKNEN